jgi:hypothetical protein
MPQDVGVYTYGHSQLKTGHPVRSAIHKQLNGRLVLRWVTTWESLLLYVLHLFLFLFFCSLLFYFAFAGNAGLGLLTIFLNTL